MATAKEMGYVEKAKVHFNYYQAGKRSKNQNVEEATDNFDELAKQYGVTSGMNGSWDNFWEGYYYE